MNNQRKSSSLLELIGGTVALLEGVPLLVSTPPETLALVVVWLWLRDRDTGHIGHQ